MMTTCSIPNLFATKMRFAFILYLSFWVNNVSSQEWQSVVDLIPNSLNPLTIWSLEASEDNGNVLYFSGIFKGLVQNEDTVYLHNMGQWNGLEYSSISGITLDEQDVGFYFPNNHLVMIDTTLFLRKVNPTTYQYPIIEDQIISSPLAKLTSTGWVDLNSVLSPTSAFFKLNNQIYVFEANPTASSLKFEIVDENSMIYGEYDSGDYDVFENFGGGIVTSAIYWNGYTYIAGNFCCVSDIMRFSENGDSDFLGGQLSVEGYVNSMVEYQGNLIVGGAFTVTDQQGNIIYNIAKWDGEQWHPLFGYGLSGGVSKLKVFDDILYVTGAFTYAYLENEWYPVSKVLAFNGQEIYRVSDDIIQGSWFVIDLTIFQNSIYIAGNFTSIQNRPIAGIARLDTPVSVLTQQFKTNESAIQLNCYPNPAVDYTFLSLNEGLMKGTIEIIDNKGSVFFQDAITNIEKYQLSLTGLKSGLYLIRYSDGKNSAVAKLMIH